MIEKKIRKFFNTVSVCSCPHADYDEELAILDGVADEIEVTPEKEDDGITLRDAARFAAKTFIILASALVLGKTVALLVDLVSGEEDDGEDD